MWSLSNKAGVSFNKKIKDIRDVPYTISYVIRKRMQIDSLKELPKDKRPPDSIMWSNDPSLLDAWIDKVLYNKEETNKDILLPLSEIEE